MIFSLAVKEGFFLSKSLQTFDILSFAFKNVFIYAILIGVRCKKTQQQRDE